MKEWMADPDDCTLAIEIEFATVNSENAYLSAAALVTYIESLPSVEGVKTLSGVADEGLQTS